MICTLDNHTICKKHDQSLCSYFLPLELQKRYSCVTLWDWLNFLHILQSTHFAYHFYERRQKINVIIPSLYSNGWFLCAFMRNQLHCRPSLVVVLHHFSLTTVYWKVVPPPKERGLYQPSHSEQIDFLLSRFWFAKYFVTREK